MVVTFGSNSMAKMRFLAAVLVVLAAGVLAAPLGRAPKRRNDWYNVVVGGAERLSCIVQQLLSGSARLGPSVAYASAT